MTTYSYTRVSTKLNQTTSNQDKLIADAGFTVDRVFADVGVSGSIPAFERPAFKEMVEVLKEGDQVVCIMIDRLGRTASDVLQTVEYFKQHNIKLRVLQLDMIDLTTSSMGKLVLTMLAAVAEMERNLTIERVVAGLNRTKAEGTILGKPPKTTPEQLKSIVREIWSGKALNELAEAYSVSTRTLGRYKKQYTTEASLKEYEEVYFKRLQQIAGNV